MKLKFTLLLKIFFGVLMTLAGLMHFIKPEMYFPFIPNFLPKYALVYISGFIEFALGIMLFFKPTNKIAILGIFLLMIAFLPLHFLDIFQSKPAIGSHLLAIIRFPIQLLLIWMAWVINRKGVS